MALLNSSVLRSIKCTISYSAFVKTLLFTLYCIVLDFEIKQVIVQVIVGNHISLHMHTSIWHLRWGRQFEISSQIFGIRRLYRLPYVIV